MTKVAFFHILDNIYNIVCFILRTSMKKYVISILMVISFTLQSVSFAADNYEIIPEAKADPNAAVNCVAGKGNCNQWTVWQRYNDQATKYSNNTTVDVGACFATGIFSWDCINDYIVYIIRFLSQVWLVIGAMMIIWSGYKYASAVFTWSWSPNTDNIKNAIIWVVIIIFSYAIIRILSSMFL